MHNSPNGRFAPGFIEFGNLFRQMWQDAAKNREKWGCMSIRLERNGMEWICWCLSDLGKSSTLLATDLDCGNTMIWLSYWKDIDHLRGFAHGDAHRAGWDWFNAFKGHPHIGIMHEIYSTPKGNWENIYHNFRPFGMGNTLLVLANDSLSKDKLTFAKGKQGTLSKTRKRGKKMAAVTSSALFRTRRVRPGDLWQQEWGGLRRRRVRPWIRTWCASGRAVCSLARPDCFCCTLYFFSCMIVRHTITKVEPT